MNNYKLCNLCNRDYVDELKEKILELDKEAVFDIGCHGVCAIGVSNVFVILNGMLIKGDTVEEVISIVKQRLNIN